MPRQKNPTPRRRTPRRGAAATAPVVALAPPVPAATAPVVAPAPPVPGARPPARPVPAARTPAAAVPKEPKKWHEKINDQAAKAEANWKAHIDPIMQDMAGPQTHDWRPVIRPEPETVEVDVEMLSGRDHARPAVIQGRYPFTCDDREVLRADGACSKAGEVPVLMWPMGRGPRTEYAGPESFNTAAFHACCKSKEELAQVLPTYTRRSGDPNKAMQAMYAEAVAEAFGLARDIDRDTTLAVKMWKQAELRELSRVTLKEREEVETALAYLMQIGYLISSDLEAIQSVAKYPEAVISGTAAAIKGAMPRLEGMDVSSALDYMRAEYYYRLGRFLTVFGTTVHNKDPLYELNRDDTWSKLSLEFVPRGVNAVVNAGWRGIKKMSLLSALVLAVPIIVAIRGLQLGGTNDAMSDLFQGFFAFDNGKWNKTNALMLTVLLEYFLEARMTRDEVPSDLSAEGAAIDQVVNGAKHYAQKYHSWNKLISSTVSQSAPGAFGFVGDIMGSPALLGGLGSAASAGGKLWGMYQDQQQSALLIGASAFAAILSLGTRLYPEFADAGPLMLAIHNALWVGGGAWAAGTALRVIESQSKSWFDWSGIVQDFMATPVAFTDMVGKVLLGDPAAPRARGLDSPLVREGLLGRLSGLSPADVSDFMTNGGPQALMALLGLLYVADKLSGEMPKSQEHMLREVETWAPRRPEGFFAQNQAFLPQADPVLLERHCAGTGRTDCAERIAKINKARAEVQRGCRHMTKAFRDRGYRVCDDY